MSNVEEEQKKKYNVEKRQQEQYSKLLDKSVNLFLSQYKFNPYEIKGVVDFIFKNVIKHNWLLGFGYQMMEAYQNGDFLEKALYSQYGITREFKGQLLTDEQMRQVAKIASVASSNSYASTQDFIKSIHLLLGEGVIIYECYYKKLYIIVNNVDDFVFDVCLSYNLIPKRLGYVNMWLFVGNETTHYFFLPPVKANAPIGYSGLVKQAWLPCVPLDKMRLI